MTSYHRYAVCLLAAAIVTCASCGGGSVGAVGGTVTIDGAPVDLGTISFRSAENSSQGVAGGAIEAGKFQVAARDVLKPGKYMVQVQATKKTGRTIKDPQRGNVDELVPMTVADSPKEVELTPEGASNLQLNFTSGQK